MLTLLLDIFSFTYLVLNNADAKSMYSKCLEKVEITDTNDWILKLRIREYQEQKLKIIMNDPKSFIIIGGEESFNYFFINKVTPLHHKVEAFVIVDETAISDLKTFYYDTYPGYFIDFA
mgnify:CR=1 FL=1